MPQEEKDTIACCCCDRFVGWWKGTDLVEKAVVFLSVSALFALVVLSVFSKHTCVQAFFNASSTVGTLVASILALLSLWMLRQHGKEDRNKERKERTFDFMKTLVQVFDTWHTDACKGAPKNTGTLIELCEALWWGIRWEHFDAGVLKKVFGRNLSRIALGIREHGQEHLLSQMADFERMIEDIESNHLNARICRECSQFYPLGDIKKVGEWNQTDLRIQGDHSDRRLNEDRRWCKTCWHKVAKMHDFIKKHLPDEWNEPKDDEAERVIASLRELGKRTKEKQYSFAALLRDYGDKLRSSFEALHKKEKIDKNKAPEDLEWLRQEVLKWKRTHSD